MLFIKHCLNMPIYYLFEGNCEWFNCDSFDDLKKLYNYHDIVRIDCWNNPAFILPSALPNSLKYLDYSKNPVDTYLRDKCDNNLEIYHRENEIFAFKLVNWYLDCRENPKFKFCRTRLNRDYDALMEEDINGIIGGIMA